jgi:hypothetical protein
MRLVPCLPAGLVSLAARSISHERSSCKELVQKQEIYLIVSEFGVELD